MSEKHEGITRGCGVQAESERDRNTRWGRSTGWGRPRGLCAAIGRLAAAPARPRARVRALDAQPRWQARMRVLVCRGRTVWL